MIRRFVVGIAAGFGWALAIGAVGWCNPARAQDPPEAWSVAAEPAVPDSTPPDVLFYYFEGNNRAYGGDPVAAIRLYRQALALDTSQVAVRLALARAYAARDQPESTLYWADEVRRRDPGRAEAHRLAGLAYVRLGRAPEAIESLRRTVALDASDTGAFMNLLFLLESSKRYGEALALIDTAEQDLSESPSLRVRRARLLVQTGRASEAVADLVSLLRAEPAYPEGEMILALALSREPDSLPDSAIVETLLKDHPELDRARSALVRVYLATDRYSGAQRHLELLAAREPGNPRILRDLGVLCFRQGKYGEAESHFRDLQKAAPVDPEAPLWLCRLAVVREHPGEAVRLAGSVLARAPGDPDALLCEATALGMLQRREEALSAVEAVLQANPAHREAGLLAATILNDLGRPAEAVDRLRLPLAGDPEDRDLLFAFGASLERAGEVDSSLAVFDRLLAANPDDDEALNHSGYICIDRGIRVEAWLDRVRRALERAPDNGAYLDSYGWGLFRLGRAQEAVDWLRRAAEKFPKEPEIRLHQGEVFEALDRPDDARAAYREALRLRPGDPEIRRRLDDMGRRPARQPAPGVPASN
jgi:Flp pilus assembly protein TadD